MSLPSVSILPSLRNELIGRRPAPKVIAVLADPVFSADDTRVRGNTSQKSSDEQKASATVTDRAGERASLESGARRDGSHLDRLPGTRREANDILALVPANRAMKALDVAASVELVRSGELGRYRYITFATHGLLDSVHPELSAIVLSLVDENGNRRDGYVRAHEIYNLDLAVDLVVLSACRTALGKDVKGEGLLGLTRGFMYAGAPRVVASLWSVTVESTAQSRISTGASSSGGCALPQRFEPRKLRCCRVRNGNHLIPGQHLCSRVSADRKSNSLIYSDVKEVQEKSQ